MRVSICLLLSAVCVLADKNGNRRTKPFIADAVGNTIPPPSNVPATVGSPISLLTPDRYEFYTFDESGELVKRLMTLEEIQAIVAAGEDSEGLVTFANDNQPTIAFNFSQPPYTKVHSVVTNVQNVLKAQMEAHKNKPLVQPTLDTPDVSDTWSLILPSIFGNSGVDIVPDKAGSSFTPETDMIDESTQTDDEESSLSKEGSVPITTTEDSFGKETQTETSVPSSTSTTTTTTTAKPTTRRPISTTIRRKLVTTTRPRTTTTKLPTSTTTTPPSTKKITTTTTSPTTVKFTTTTTKKPTTTTTTTTITTTTTTAKPSTTTSIPKTTPKLVTKKNVFTTSTATPENILSNDIPIYRPLKEFEKISTFIPVSTVKYVTERTTHKPLGSTKSPLSFASTTKRSPSTTTKSPRPLSSTQEPKLQTTVRPSTIHISSTAKDTELERLNITTITTQSVSPSTTVSTTEFSLPENSHFENTDEESANDVPILPIFDVAQSISQIASDLGNNYQPIPTSSNLLDTTKVNSEDDLESKENIEMDIPNEEQNVKNQSEDNFVKISTIDPHPLQNDQAIESQQNTKEANESNKKEEHIQSTTETITTTESSEGTTLESNLSDETTIDPILNESMEDLLSQVVHEAPQSVLDAGKKENDINSITTEKIVETTTDLALDVTTELPTIIVEDSSTEKVLIEIKEKAPVEMATKNIDKVKDKIVSSNINKVNTENKLNTKHNKTETPVKTTFQKVTTIPDTVKDKNVPSNNNKVNTEDQFNTKHEKVETPVKTSTEKITISDKIIEKNVPSNNNKVNTVDKFDIKDDNSKDFVKISMPASANATENKKDENSDPKTNSDKNVVPQKPEKFVQKVKIPQFVQKVKITQAEEKVKAPQGDQKVKIPQGEQKVKISQVILTTTSKADITTKTPTLLNDSPKLGDVSALQSNINKISASEKTNSTNKKDKIPESVPKIDEFKKKIQKINDEELASDRNDPWKLIPTVTPPKTNDISKDKVKPDVPLNSVSSEDDRDVVLEYSKENQGLEVTTKDLGEDIAEFTELCNELAFRYWHSMVENIDKKRSFVLSPYSITSMLAMMFMGARGATSGEMNEILKLDDMVTFNPHFTLKNISDSIESATDSGIAISAFVRELFSDRNKGKILTFYKERAQHFYSGHVEEINFKLISDIIRRRTNLLVKKHTWGKIPEYMKTNYIAMNPPLAAFSTNIFQTDCAGTSVDGRDGEMYFVVSPNVRQRRLVPVPAVVYKSGFLAGYDPVIDATAAALGNTNSIVSTIFLMPGQQGNIVHADDLDKLEQRLLESNPTTPAWSRVLRTLLPRVGLELQIPRFSHKSVFNVSSTLKEMGLKDLFDAEHADLGGLIGPSKDLFLSDMVQVTSFVTCGEGLIGDQHHIEEYPDASGLARRRTSRWADWDEPRDYQRAFHDPHDVGDAMHLPLHLRPRQARLPTRSVQPARLKFDRPFLFFVRHNPSGMILYVGRYNPRLLP